MKTGTIKHTPIDRKSPQKRQWLGAYRVYLAFKSLATTGFQLRQY